MISSTSSSDPPAGDLANRGADASWRRWIIVFCTTFFGLGGLLFTLLLLIDPYDSARFPTLGIVGIDDHNPRMANVSRGRDPAFDGAVFGNSTGQLIDPHRIGPPTGLSFTQLTVPATGPREQLAMMGWFASHHDKLRALILVADNSWCAQSPDLQVTHPFPFWLYGGDRDYVTHVLNSKSLDRAVWRVQLAFGMRPRTDPVGYSDYMAGKNFHVCATSSGSGGRSICREVPAAISLDLPPAGSDCEVAAGSIRYNRRAANLCPTARPAG